MRIIIEGWRLLPHSFCITNQFLLLEMIQRPNLEIFHRDIPYLDEHWQPTTGLLNEVAEATLRSIPTPSPSQAAEATLRISVPYNFAPSTTEKTYLFGTTEWGILHNESFRITGANSLREGHLNSDIIIITPSHWSRDGFIRSGANPDRVTVIPCGVDTNIYKPLSAAERQELRAQLGWEGFVFLNIGGITPNKGIDLLLTAFATVVDRYPDARLVLKGEESIYWSNSLFDEKISNLSLDEAEKILPRLAYIGDTLSFSEMAQLYQAADAYVSPYLAEGFNLPVLEAIACGLPAICTKGGATDDFTHPDFTFFINSTFQEGTSKEGPIFRVFPDLDHLIELMQTIMEQSVFREQARYTGPQFVTNKFTWKQTADQLLNLIFS
ncbi:MAG: glycosyltransferase [Actinomycetota bacterium]